MMSGTVLRRKRWRSHARSWWWATTGIPVSAIELGQGQAEGQVERDRQGVLDDEQLEVEGGAELVQLRLQVGLQLLDPPREACGGRTYGE